MNLKKNKQLRISSLEHQICLLTKAHNQSFLKLKALMEKEDEQSSENFDEISSRWSFKGILIKIKSIDSDSKGW